MNGWVRISLHDAWMDDYVGRLEWVSGLGDDLVGGLVDG